MIDARLGGIRKQVSRPVAAHQHRGFDGRERVRISQRTSERERRVLSLRKVGASYGAIGRMLGLSASRAHQIYREAENRQKADPLEGLPTMTVNAMSSAFIDAGFDAIPDRKALLQFVQSGRLRLVGIYAHFDGMRIVGMGRKGFTGLCLWLGADVPPRRLRHGTPNEHGFSRLGRMTKAALVEYLKPLILTATQLNRHYIENDGEEPEWSEDARAKLWTNLRDLHDDYGT